MFSGSPGREEGWITPHPALLVPCGGPWLAGGCVEGLMVQAGPGLERAVIN